MPADLDAKVGAFFERFTRMRHEFDDPSFEMTLQVLMQALGAAAMHEAERRARIIVERSRPASGPVRVVPFAQRRPPEPLHGCDRD